MTTIPLSTEPPVSDNIDVEKLWLPSPHLLQHKFDVDDAFSVHDDDAPETLFDPSADSFLKQLRSRPSIRIEENEEDVEDLQDSQQTGYDSTNASVSTLNSDALAGSSHLPSHSPPRASSSSHSFHSEELPPTPPDDTPTSSTDVHPSLMNVSLSASPDSPTHAIRDDEQGSYPNIVIDVSKTHATRVFNFPSSMSQQTTGMQSSSSSSTSEHAIDRVDLASKDHSFHHPTQSVSTSPSPPLAGHRSSQSISTVSKPTRASGPSTLQKVISKTRPPHLPPKQKDEDEKHHKEWQEMMERSRAADQQRRDALEVRRLARELSVEANTSLWQRAVIPDWKKAVSDPQLRKLWWDGVPTKLRSVIWDRVVGNPLALSRDSYLSALARAKNLLMTQRFPKTSLAQMEADISRTLPQLHIFHRRNGPLYGDLRDLLCAWLVSRADEGLGYVDGVAKIGGMLILNLTGPAQAFVVMRNLLETGCLRAFYGGEKTRDDVEAYYRIFDTLLADGMPKVYFNFKQHQISPAAYLPGWLMPLFLDHLPLEACLRIWDVLLLEGDAFLFRAALAMLACLESRLFFPDRAELIAVLQGKSPAALQVAVRTGSRSPVSSEDSLAGPLYDIYGVNEETVWERVMGMDEWWKESTWQRLFQREMPDL